MIVYGLQDGLGWSFTNYLTGNRTQESNPEIVNHHLDKRCKNISGHSSIQNKSWAQQRAENELRKGGHSGGFDNPHF